MTDILTAGITGSGGITAEIGGVRTQHDTTFFDNPLDDVPSVAPDLGVPPVITAPGAPGIPGTEGTNVAGLPGSAGTASNHCETTHPSGSPGCSKEGRPRRRPRADTRIALLAGDWFFIRRNAGTA